MIKELRKYILNRLRIEPVVYDQNDMLYMQGFQNTAIRYFKYYQDGASLTSQIEGLITKAAAVYFFLSLTSIWLIAIGVIGWVIFCLIMGWYNTHRMIRTMEEINLKLSTHYGKKSYQAGQDTPELLRQILKELKKKNKSVGKK